MHVIAFDAIPRRTIARIAKPIINTVCFGTLTIVTRAITAIVRLVDDLMKTEFARVN